MRVRIAACGRVASRVSGAGTAAIMVNGRAPPISPGRGRPAKRKEAFVPGVNGRTGRARAVRACDGRLASLRGSILHGRPGDGRDARVGAARAGVWWSRRERHGATWAVKFTPYRSRWRAA